MSTMTTSRPAQHSGTFLIGGELPVVRLGFGAMRLTGPGIWESLQILVRPLPHPRWRWPAAAHPHSARRRRPGWHAPGTASRAVRSATRHSHTSPADVPATRYAPSFFASPPQDVAYFVDFHDSRDFGVQLRPNPCSFNTAPAQVRNNPVESTWTPAGGPAQVRRRAYPGEFVKPSCD